MNICLLSKWIMRLEGGDKDMCLEVLRKKIHEGQFLSKLRGWWFSILEGTALM